jgi:phosphoserine phosphatase
MNVLPLTAAENAERIRSAARAFVDAARGRPVFLVDGDRTLTPEDTSRTFLTQAGLDPIPIKERFQRDGYVYEAFRFHAEVHLGLGEHVFAELAPRIAGAVRLHPGAREFLVAASSRALVVVVSAGIPRVWREILDQHGLSEVPVIGGIDPSNPFVFGRREKGLVTKLFRAKGQRVVGVGDSDVDTEMLLQSDDAVVVVNHRRNADLMPHVASHPSLWQVVAQAAPHPGIRIMPFERLASVLD